MADTAIVWETHLVYKVSFFVVHMQILWKGNNTTLYWALDYVGLDDELSSHPAGLTMTTRTLVWLLKSILTFELDVCFGVWSRPRKTNVKNGNWSLKGWRPGGLNQLTLNSLFCSAKMYMYISFSFSSFLNNYWILLYVVTCYHNMALFRCWLCKKGRGDQDWHLYIYCLTTEEWYQHLWWQPSAPTETKSAVLTFVCLRETLYKLHIFFLLVCSGHKRNCIAVFIVNQIRMYLSSQSQMLYLI